MMRKEFYLVNFIILFNRISKETKDTPPKKNPKFLAKLSSESPSYDQGADFNNKNESPPNTIVIIEKTIIQALSRLLAFLIL